MDGLRPNWHFINRLMVIVTIGVVVGTSSTPGFSHARFAGVKSVNSNHSILLTNDQEQQSREILAGQAEKNLNRSNLSFSAVHHLVKDRLPAKYKEQSKEITKAIFKESRKANLDPMFVVAIIETESTFDPDSVGIFNEIGLMQLRECTAKWIVKKLNLNLKLDTEVDLQDPVTNIIVGAAYMGYLKNRFKNSGYHYTAAYNMGTTSVLRLIASNKEPRIYPNKVKKHYKEAYDSLSATELAESEVAPTSVQTTVSWVQ